MKEIINIMLVLFVVMLCAFGTLQAQVIDESYCPMHTIEEPAETSAKLMSSCNPSTDICTGKYKPGKGTLKMLMVYIRFADDNTSMSYWNSTPNPNNIYDVETWMEESLDENISIGSDNYFNVTNYFNQMSRGSYNVIGDVVYIELPSKSTFVDTLGNDLEGLALMKATNKYALEYLDNNSQIDLSDYDNFDYVSTNHHDQASDNILDMVYMVYRTPGAQHFAGVEYSSFGGIAMLGGGGKETLPSGLVVDYSAFAEGSGLTMHLGENRKERFDDSYIHELAHYLMGGNHPYTDGSWSNSIGRSGYWGIFGGSQATNSVNSYEQELLGWIDVPELTSTQNFSLGDFITTGDAFKYSLSPTEYYYFENRQRIQTTNGIYNTYDQPNWNSDDKGLFILHVKENSSGNYLYHSDNSLESIVSDGNWDWNIDEENSWQVDQCNPSGEPAFYKNKPNRFGESFKEPIMEVDNPNDSEGSYMQSLFVKSTNPVECKKYFLGYDSSDKSGFSQTERSLISPYTNPVFLTRTKSLVDIGVKINGKLGSTLQLKFYDSTHDHYTITDNTTWDRQIYLEESVIVDNNATLSILPGTTVYLGENVNIVIKPGAKILAEGTSSFPIKFKRLDPTKKWNVIALQSSAGNSFKWVLFDGGYKTISLQSNNNTFEHCTFRNAWRGMEGWTNQDGTGNADATISYSLIEYNSSVGIVAHYVDLDISYTTIRDNAQAGLYVSSSNVNSFHHNQVVNNGGTTRDGIEVKSSGSLYLLENSVHRGFNEISGNGEDQISNFGSLTVGTPFHLVGGYNSIDGDYSGSQYLVENNSGSIVNIHYNWWGQSTVSSAMFSGSISGFSQYLTSNPVFSSGHGGQVPSKALPDNEDNVNLQETLTAYYDEIEDQLFQASANQQVRDNLHRLYEISGWASKINPELTIRFKALTKGAAIGMNNLYSTSALNASLQSTSNILQAKLLVREGDYESAEKWLNQKDAPSFEGYDGRDWLHLKLVTQIYHGKYEIAWQTLQDYYAFQKTQGEDMEEVRTNNAIIEEDLKALLNGSEGVINEQEKNDEVDLQELNSSNYPNPFNPTTNIRFTLTEKNLVSLVVYDMLGREVATLVDGVLSAGEQTVRFDASNLANGMYVYKLRAGNQEVIKKMTLIK